MPKSDVNPPYRNLIWRLLTFSARTQISFTVREGSLFLEDGRRHVELFMDERSMDRPKTVIVPGPMNKLGEAIARVFLPEWMSKPHYYPILEKYLAKIFMLGNIPERFIPVIGMPNELYSELTKQNRLTLDCDFSVKKRKSLVLYEFRIEKGVTRLRLLDNGEPMFDFIVHIEPRRGN